MRYSLMYQPPLSVITPIYNCETYLRESLDSALSQTFTDFELIIVNDGSTDGSVDIVKSYDDERIIFVDNQDNKKIPTRRNEAISMASGKYVAIHDGDDVSFPHRFAKQIDILSSEDIFCVGAHADKIDPDGDRTGDMDYPPETHDEILHMITRKCMNPMIDPTCMFVRDVFMQLGKYTLEKEIYTVPDFDLWLRAMGVSKKFYNIQEPLIKYRENPDGMTGKHKREMIKAHMIVWRRFMHSYRSILTGGIK